MSYLEDGFLLVKGLLAKEEAKRLRDECHGLTERLEKAHDTDATWAGARAMTAQKTVIHHCHNVQFYSGALTKLLTDDRFTAIAAQLIGAENVQMHHNKMFIKPPEKGSPFPMHQDHPYFPHARHTMTAVIFHFDDAPAEKGCLRVVPGSHRLGPLPHEGSFHLPPEKFPLEGEFQVEIDSKLQTLNSKLVEAEAGDAIFFNYLTIHGSGVNTSAEARTTLLVQFKDPTDPPLDDQHKSRGQGMMLRGIDPNPVPQFLE